MIRRWYDPELGKLIRLEEKSKKLLRPIIRRTICYVSAIALLGATNLYLGLKNREIKRSIEQEKAQILAAENSKLEPLYRRIEEISAQISAKDAEAEMLSAYLSAKNAELERQREAENSAETPLSPQLRRDDVLRIEEGQPMPPPAEAPRGAAAEETATIRDAPAPEPTQPQSIEELLRQGLDYFDRGEYEKATEAYRKAEEAENERIDVDAHYGLGTALSVLGNVKEGEERIRLYEMAAAHLEEAVKGRGNASDFYQLGKILARLADEKNGEEKARLYERAGQYLARAAGEIEDARALLNRINSYLERAEESAENVSSSRIMPDVGIGLDGLATPQQPTEPELEDDAEAGNESLAYILLTVGGSQKPGTLSFGFEADIPFNRSVLGGGASFAYVGGDPWEDDPQYEWGNETEIYILGGVRFNNIIVAATIGSSSQRVEGEYDSWKDEREWTTWSVQLRFPKKNLVGGVGYHNRRKLVGSIGFTF